MVMTDNEFDFYFEQFSELNRIDMAKLFDSLSLVICLNLQN